ncbi:hypothetical protein DB346_19000 [Verrucomicrobia bacterium LW23]|nr:hypothetical protein DB346_19000 [Verrucomicrobia bacterium LW23]
MHLLTAAFDPETAISRVSEIFALSDSPERIAEKLNVPNEVDRVKDGMAVPQCKRLLADIDKLRAFVDLEKQIEDVKAGKWSWNFLGKSARDAHLAKLLDKRRKFGSLIEAPRWFYRLDRVWLLHCIRDYALDSATQMADSEWIEVDDNNANGELPYPIVSMFEAADTARAKTIILNLERPFKDVSPEWVLKDMEGHRALHFDFEKRMAVYFQPLRV